MLNYQTDCILNGGSYGKRDSKSSETQTVLMRKLDKRQEMHILLWKGQNKVRHLEECHKMVSKSRVGNDSQ